MNYYKKAVEILRKSVIHIFLNKYHDFTIIKNGTNIGQVFLNR